MAFLTQSGVKRLWGYINAKFNDLTIAIKKTLPLTGGNLTGNLSIQTSLYPTLYLKPTYNDTTSLTVFEGSYEGASSFAAWEDNTGNDRRMLEVRTKAYEDSLDNAVMVRVCDNGTWRDYRIFHEGMETGVPISKGGTGATTASGALTNLGIIYSSEQPTYVEGRIWLKPINGGN